MNIINKIPRSLNIFCKRKNKRCYNFSFTIYLAFTLYRPWFKVLLILFIIKLYAWVNKIVNNFDWFRVVNFDFLMPALCLQCVTTVYQIVPYTLSLHLQLHLWEFCTIFSGFSEMLLCVLFSTHYHVLLPFSWKRW